MVVSALVLLTAAPPVVAQSALPPAVKGDLNGDGNSDLILYQFYSTPAHVIWFMNGTERIGTGTFTPAVEQWSAALADRQAASPGPDVPGPLPGQWKVVGVDDFDRDGQSDLVVQNGFRSDYVQIWLMTGTTRRELVTLTLVPGLVRAVADFNHDTKPDILLQTNAGLLVWTMDGTNHVGALTPTPAAAVDANWAVVAAHDYDGDTNPDLLWYNATSGKAVLWLLDANLVRTTGRFTSPAQAGDSNWKVAASADFGPGAGPGGVLGAPDLVWRNETSGKFVIWFMDRAGVRTSGAFTNPDGLPAPALGAFWEPVAPR
jgi:hypothetical protein